MSSALAVSPCGRAHHAPATRSAGLIVRLLCLSLLGAVCAVPAQAVPMLTKDGGVMNPPPNKVTTGLVNQQTAIANQAELVPVGTFGPILQSLLTMQSYSAANNWTLNTNQLTLAANATFNVTQYDITLNGAGDAFGEEFAMTLNPNLAAPVNPPLGSTVTQHWLQIFNQSWDSANGYAGTQLAAPNNTGYWYIDNGFVAGAKVDATNNGAGTNNGHNGPYYDSNNNSVTTGMTFSVPPSFYDPPGFFPGVGFFLDFTVIPVWDVYTPAAGANPATDTMYVADYGVTWGFRIVPEPGTIVLLACGTFGLLIVAIRRRRQQ